MADASIQRSDDVPTDVDWSGDTTGPSKKVAVAGIVLVVVVAAVAVGLRLTGTSSAATTSAVRGALVSTFANETAVVSISESIDVEGQIGTAQGRGKCDLQSDACSATLAYHGALSQLGTESMVYSNRIMYLKLSGTVGASFPTPWISLSPKASNRPSALGSTGSPLAGLALLTRPGATLHDEGVVAIDGVSMHQYSVTIHTSSTKRIDVGGASELPGWLVDPASEGPLGARSMTLDVDASGAIGRIVFTTSARQDGTFAIVRATETFTGDGAPVTVTVPAKGQRTFVNALAGTLTRYCTPAPGLRLGPASKPIVTRH